MNQFQRLEEFLRASLLIGGFVAVATLIVMQTVKPMIKSYLQRRLLSRWDWRPWFMNEDLLSEDNWPAATSWLRQSPMLKAIDEIKPPFEDRDRYQQGRWHDSGHWIGLAGEAHSMMETDMLMRLLSNRATAALESPRRNLTDFMVFTRGATPEDRAAAVYLDDLRTRHPELHSKLVNHRAPEGDGPSPMAAAIAGLRESLSAAAERNLDRLQALLKAQWRNWGRLLALAVGATIALAVGLASGTINQNFLLLLGSPVPIGAIGFGALKLFIWLDDSWGHPGWRTWLLLASVAIPTLVLLAVLIWLLVPLEPWRGAGAAGSILFVGALAGLLASFVHDGLKSLSRLRR